MAKRSPPPSPRASSKPNKRPRLVVHFSLSGSRSISVNISSITRGGSSNTPVSAPKTKQSPSQPGPSLVGLAIYNITAYDMLGQRYEDIYYTSVLIWWHRAPDAVIEYTYNPATHHIWDRTFDATQVSRPPHVIRLGETHMKRDEWNQQLERLLVEHPPRMDKWRLAAFLGNIIASQMIKLLGLGDVPGHILLQPTFLETTRWATSHSQQWRQTLPLPTMRPSLDPNAVVPAMGPCTTVAELAALESFVPANRFPYTLRSKRRYSLTGTSTFFVHVPITSTSRKRSNSDGTIQTDAELVVPSLRLAPSRKFFYRPSDQRQLSAIVAQYPCAFVCYVDHASDLISQQYVRSFLRLAKRCNQCYGAKMAFLVAGCDKVKDYSGPTPTAAFFLHGNQFKAPRHPGPEFDRFTRRTHYAVNKEAFKPHPHTKVVSKVQPLFDRWSKEVVIFPKRASLKRLTRQMDRLIAPVLGRQLLLWIVRGLHQRRNDGLPRVCNLSEAQADVWLAINQLYFDHFPLDVQFPMLSLLRFAFAPQAGISGLPSPSFHAKHWALLGKPLASVKESFVERFLQFCETPVADNSQRIILGADSTMLACIRLATNVLAISRMAPHRQRYFLRRPCLSLLETVCGSMVEPLANRTPSYQTELHLACLAAAHNFLVAPQVHRPIALVRETSSTWGPFAKGHKVLREDAEMDSGLFYITGCLGSSLLEWSEVHGCGQGQVSRAALEALRWNILLCINAIYMADDFDEMVSLVEDDYHWNSLVWVHFDVAGLAFDSASAEAKIQSEILWMIRVLRALWKMRE